MSEHPTLLQTVIDARNPREVAEFYREFLGLTYRPGDEPPSHGPDDAEWLVLTDASGRRMLAIQGEPEARPTTWPHHEVPMQMHLDLTVPDVDALERQRERALALGATQVLDRSDDADEPLYVFTDPAGHPFCVFVA